MSLIGTDINMVSTRQGTGNVFNGYSWRTGQSRLAELDPWLVGLALVARRRSRSRGAYGRAIALAYLIQVVSVFRPGYLPYMYVIGMLPFAALIVVGSRDACGVSQRVVTGHQRLAGKHMAAVVWAAAEAGGGRGLDRDDRRASGGCVIRRSAVGGRRSCSDDSQEDGPERAAERWLVAHVGREQAAHRPR